MIQCPNLQTFWKLLYSHQWNSRRAGSTCNITEWSCSPPVRDEAEQSHQASLLLPQVRLRAHHLRPAWRGGGGAEDERLPADEVPLITPPHTQQVQRGGLGHTGRGHWQGDTGERPQCSLLRPHAQGDGKASVNSAGTDANQPVYPFTLHSLKCLIKYIE